MTLTGGRLRRRNLAPLLLAGLALAACATAVSPSPSATPRPTTDLAAERASARAAVDRFVDHWAAGRIYSMLDMLDVADRARFGDDSILGLLRDFDEMLDVASLRAEVGQVEVGSLPPDDEAQGPRPALTAHLWLEVVSRRFGPLRLSRQLTVVPGAEGWDLRWSAALLFPELGDDGRLELTRSLGPRGRILAADGTVFATNRDDGLRIYPQEWLAGQTIGWVSPATADEAANLGDGYAAGDPIGRGGLELGAEALLRGTPGYMLTALAGAAGAVDAPATPVLRTVTVPGADLTITLRPDIQRVAEAAIGSYNEAATAVLDPSSGDVWALASAPLFNPNAMVLGTTLSGQPLSAPSASARTNHAVASGYPAGSSFKPFTLLAALRTGVADRSTRMSCNGTWVYDGFRFINYELHSLGDSVSLTTAMAFSCNTTYMPLSIRVWEADPVALTDLIAEFGFGSHTGIPHLADTAGILPDADYFTETPRWNGEISPYGPFDQIQLAIGQGSYLGSALQLARAYAAFANDGTLWVPRLVTRAALPGGRVVEAIPPRVGHQVEMAPDDWVFLRETLLAVTASPYGTAHYAFTGFGIPVAGKSGTAETGTDKPDALFPAFAPVEDARIAVATILVKVPLATGGSDSAPLVRRVMGYFFANE